MTASLETLVALAVAQAATGECSDRKFLGMIGYRLRGCFPHLPDQSQSNRRLRRLTPQITQVQLALAELIATGRARLLDGHPDLGRQLRRLRPEVRVRRPRRRRLLRLEVRVGLGDAPGLAHRRSRGAARL